MLQIITVSNSHVDASIYFYTSHARENNSVILSGNTFVETTPNQQYIQTHHVAYVFIKGNTFTNYTYPLLDIRMTSVRTLLITNNMFVSSKNPLTLRVSGDGRNEAVEIKDNVFIDNNGDYVLKLIASAYKATVTVHDNRFWNNSADTTALLDSGYAASLTRNMFDNPLARCDVKVTAAYSASSVVYATQNWWGSGRYSDVTSRIYDHSVESSLARVVFQPYLTARNLSALSRSATGFFRGPTTIGGTISQDTYLKKLDTPYVVVDDITIPVGVSLTVEAGTHIKFLQGGVVVEGNLKSKSPFCLSRLPNAVAGRGKD